MTSRAVVLGGALRRWRARPGSRESVLVTLAVVGGIVVGRSIANEQIMFAGAVAGFVLVVALAQAPWLPYVGCVALVSTFAHPPSLPQFALPGTPTLTDLMLVAAFSSWLLILARGDIEAPSAFPAAPQIAMGLFFVAVLAGVVVGSANGAQYALVDARDVAYFATFWLALSAFATPNGRTLVLRLGAFVAAALVVAQIAQGLLGAGVMLFYDSDPLRELLICPSGHCADPLAEGFPRVRPPGLVLIYVATCFSASYLLWGPRLRRKSVGALLVLCVIGLLVSLNRNMLIGAMAGLLLAGLLAARRGRFIAAAVVVVVLAVASLEVLRATPGLAGSSIASRVVSITAVSELESSDTVSDRVQENNAALDALAKSPLVGLGWGVPFQPPELVVVDGEFRTETTLFIHNQYLGLWMRTGLVGLGAFFAAIGLSLVYATRWLRSRADRDDAWLGAAVIVSIVAIGLSSLVAIYVIHPSWAPILAGLFALATTLKRELTRAE